MPTIAEQNRLDTDLMYELLQEGKLDLMYLPAGAIAWLWDRPDSQVNAARDLAVAAKDICPVTSAAVLRSDQNILVLKCEDGHKFNVYPDGGYGCDGESLDVHGCMQMLDNGMEPMPAEECPMEDSSHTSGDQPDMGPFYTDDAIAADVGDQVIGVAEDEGESILDDEREKRGTDLICKMRSVGNPLAKALQGKAGKRDAMEEEGDVESDGTISTDRLAKANNEAFLKAMAPDEIQEVLRAVLDGIQWLATKHATSSLRALKIRELHKTHEGKQRIVNDWLEAGAPFPLLDGFHTTKAGPYKHQGEQFMAWEREYLQDPEGDFEKHQKIKSQGQEAWKAYTDKYLADVPVDEAQGQQGIAGPVSTDMYDWEDEMPEIEMMVGEALKEEIGREHIALVTIDLDDEDTGEYVYDFPVYVTYTVSPEEYYTSMGQRKTDYDIEVLDVEFAKDLIYRGKKYRSGMKFPGWLMSHLPFNVINRKSAGENAEAVFHGWLADKIQAGKD